MADGMGGWAVCEVVCFLHTTSIDLQWIASRFLTSFQGPLFHLKHLYIYPHWFPRVSGDIAFLQGSFKEVWVHLNFSLSSPVIFLQDGAKKYGIGQVNKLAQPIFLTTKASILCVLAWERTWTLVHSSFQWIWRFCWSSIGGIFPVPWESLWQVAQNSEAGTRTAIDAVSIDMRFEPDLRYWPSNTPSLNCQWLRGALKVVVN